MIKIKIIENSKHIPFLLLFFFFSWKPSYLSCRNKAVFFVSSGVFWKQCHLIVQRWLKYKGP